MTYAQLSELLAEIGVQENEKNVANKIGRGTFNMVFFMQCMEAIGVEHVRFD